MKQTAVEFLVNYMKSNFHITDDSLEIFKQAKEMEKEQIINAGNSCALKQHLHSNIIDLMSDKEINQYLLEPPYTFGEQYYNEKFKQIKNHLELEKAKMKPSELIIDNFIIELGEKLTTNKEDEDNN